MTNNNDQLFDLSNKTSRSTIADIDAVAQRGGFKGEELSTIGTLRDQCIQVVQLCETIQQEKAMETPAEEPAKDKK